MVPFKTWSKLCTQGSFLTVLRGLYVMRGIELEATVCKVRDMAAMLYLLGPMGKKKGLSEG